MALRPTTIIPDSAHALDRPVGFSIAETGAAAAVVNLRDGTAAGQKLTAPIQLTGGETATLVLDEVWEITHDDGIYVEVVSGDVAGVLYSRPFKYTISGGRISRNL